METPHKTSLNLLICTNCQPMKGILLTSVQCERSSVASVGHLVFGLILSDLLNRKVALKTKRADFEGHRC